MTAGPITSNTMLNNSAKNEHLYLVPVPRRNTFSFSSLSMMLSVGLAYMDFVLG